MTKINFIILIFLIPPLFAKEVGEYIGKEEAQFIYKVYKEQYFEVNKIIQAGSQLEKVRSSLGQEECQKQAQPMQEYWNELNNKVKDFDRKAYHFIKTVTKKSLSCVSCNESYFSKHCKLVDRGLEMLRPVYGERPGKRIYDTKKYPHNGLRFPKDGGPGVTPGERKSYHLGRIHKSGDSSTQQDSYKNIKDEEYVAFVGELPQETNSDLIDDNFSVKFGKKKLGDIHKNVSSNLFKIISSRYQKKILQLK